MALKIHGNSKTKWNNDPYFTLNLDSAVTQMANRFGYIANVLDNNNTNNETIDANNIPQVQAFQMVGMDDKEIHRHV